MPKLSSGSRTKVTREDIVEAAMLLADREGLAAVTMRRLGAELGVDPVVVYRHFEGKEDLLEAAADWVLATVHPPLENPDWRQGFSRPCRSLRAALLAHPALAPLVMTRPPQGENQFQGTECML